MERSRLSELQKSFNAFKMYHGCVFVAMAAVVVVVVPAVALMNY